jgi:antitoxin (DNA-binding transcriptional repressor) of toxin-antitoxin stability system
LGALLDRVQKGEEIVITRHGKPVARLVPETGARNLDAARAAAARLRARASAQTGRPIAQDEWKAFREEGRA